MINYKKEKFNLARHTASGNRAASARFIGMIAAKEYCLIEMIWILRLGYSMLRCNAIAARHGLPSQIVDQRWSG